MAEVEADYIQEYNDAPEVELAFMQHFSDMPMVAADHVQLYDLGAPVVTADFVQTCDNAWTVEIDHVQPYALRGVVEIDFVQQYYFGVDSVESDFVQPYDLLTNNIVEAEFVQPYSILSGEPTVTGYDITLTVAGEQRKVISGRFKQDRDQYIIDGSFVLASQTDYVSCGIGDAVEFTIDGILSCTLFVEGKGRTLSHGEAEYTISCVSPTAKLDKPYADDVEAAQSGLASSVITALADGYTVSYGLTDWDIPSSKLVPADQSPLEMIRQVAATPGGVVNTQLDGTLQLKNHYPVSPPDWDTVTPDYYLSDVTEFFSIAESFSSRPGYNKFLISDTTTTDDSLTLEEESDNSGHQKYIRAYRVPWVDDFTIRHTGGDWVSLEDVAVTEEQIEEEQVEITNGEGRTSKSIYSVDSIEWLQTNLGTVTHGEDGRVTTSLAGESLLSITYTTKYRRYKVADYKQESVQLVVESADGEVLATIVPVFGAGTGGTGLCVIELDEEFNTDASGNSKTTFQPDDLAGFTVHHDTKATTITKIETSAGITVYRGQVMREETRQTTWTEDDTQTLTHLPSGAVSVDWYGTEGALQVTDQTMSYSGDLPSICDVTYSYSSQGYTLVPPPMTLEDDDRYPIVVLVYLEGV